MSQTSSTPLDLSPSDRAQLQRLVDSRTSSQALALRAKVILERAERHRSDRSVAQKLGVSPHMVGKWRARFIYEGLDGLTERRRPGRPSVVTEAATVWVAKHIVQTPASPRTRPSTRSIASAAGISQTAASRILRILNPAAASTARYPSIGVEAFGGLYIDTSVRAIVLIGDFNPATGWRNASKHDVNGPRLAMHASAYLLSKDVASRSLGGADHPGRFVQFLQAIDRDAPIDHQIHVFFVNTTGSSSPVEDCPGLARMHLHSTSTLTDWLADIQALLQEPDRFREAAYEELAEALRNAVAACYAPDPPKQIKILAQTAAPVRPLRQLSDAAIALGSAQRLADPRPQEEDQVALRPAEQVAAALREQITTGRFHPGERIKEAPLISRLGISRGHVRTAIRELAHDGLLVLLPNRGATIPEVTPEDILEVYAARAALGEVLLRRVARLDVSSLLPVRSALNALVYTARFGDRSRVNDADAKFQDAVAVAAKARQTTPFFLRLSLQLRMYISILNVDYSGVYERIVNQDVAIFEALATGNAARAAEIWRAKIDVAVQYMVSQLPAADFDAGEWKDIVGRAPHPG